MRLFCSVAWLSVMVSPSFVRRWCIGCSPSAQASYSYGTRALRGRQLRQSASGDKPTHKFEAALFCTNQTPFVFHIRLTQSLQLRDFCPSEAGFAQDFTVFFPVPEVHLILLVRCEQHCSRKCAL